MGSYLNRSLSRFDPKRDPPGSAASSVAMAGPRRSGRKGVRAFWGFRVLRVLFGDVGL